MTVFAEVTLQVGANAIAFDHFVGDPGKMFYYDETTRLFQKTDGNQAQLNGKATAYAAGQAAIDQAFVDFDKGRNNQVNKGRFDLDANLQAVVSWATDEINTLRALHALPALTPAAVDAVIKNKIDNP